MDCHGCAAGMKREWDEDDGIWFHIDTGHIEDPDEVWGDCEAKDSRRPPEKVGNDSGASEGRN